MSGNVKKEFGDYQTPLDFCYRVCNYIKESRLAEDAAAIMEPIILKLIGEYKHTNSTICMLCKTSVARNVVSELSRNHIAYQKVEMLNFNSSKIFGISASACVLIIKLSTDEACAGEIVCEVKDFDKKSVIDTLIVSGDTVKTARTITDLEGKCQFVWRQGVKHDCGKVMVSTKNRCSVCCMQANLL